METLNKKDNLLKYFWQITYAHTFAYFVAGIFAMSLMNYKELFATDIISSFMRSVDEPIIVLGGTVLQIIRGIIIALIILPLRKIFFGEKYGLIKLGLIIFGFSYLSTIGPGIGSFEGYVYTIIPVMYQIWGLPETLMYIGLFIGILYLAIKYEHKKIMTVLPIILMVFLSLMGIVGFLTAAGFITA